MYLLREVFHLIILIDLYRSDRCLPKFKRLLSQYLYVYVYIQDGMHILYPFADSLYKM